MSPPIWIVVIWSIAFCSVTAYLIGCRRGRLEAKKGVMVEHHPLDERVRAAFIRLCEEIGIQPCAGVSQLSGLCEYVENLRRGAVLPHDKWKARADALYAFFVGSTAPWHRDTHITTAWTVTSSGLGRVFGAATASI